MVATRNPQPNIQCVKFLVRERLSHRISGLPAHMAVSDLWNYHLHNLPPAYIPLDTQWTLFMVVDNHLWLTMPGMVQWSSYGRTAESTFAVGNPVPKFFKQNGWYRFTHRKNQKVPIRAAM